MADDVPERDAVQPDPAAPANGLSRDTVDALAAIVRSSDDAIYSKDDRATVTSWNPAAERLYGWTAEEAIGRPIRELIIPEPRWGEELDILNRILDGERVEHYETDRMRKDGSIVQVSVSVSPVHDAKGKVVQAAAVARDVTAQKEMEEVLAARDRKQALELNDNVIQALAVAKIALETDHNDRALTAMREALERARDIASDLLTQATGKIQPGDLVRGEPAPETEG